MQGTSYGSSNSMCSGANWEWLESMCPATPSCSSQYSCSSCTALSNCGWCPSTGTCMEGTSSGANGGSCTGNNWDWYVSSCPSNVVSCSSQYTCSSCSALSECGWCANTGTCVQGTASGANGGMCSGTQWEWLESMCQVAPLCSSQSSCSSCTALGECGWCSSTGRCMHGTFFGSNGGQCYGNNWDWLVSTCPIFHHY